MDISLYRNYIQVIECGSLTAAARKLNLAQPALSNQMKRLEDEYGARLFEKGQGRHSMSLTPAGKLFFRHATKIVEDEEKLRRELQERKDSLRGRFVVKIFDFEMVEWVEDFFIPILHKRYPNLLPEIHFAMLSERRQTGLSDGVELKVLSGSELAEYSLTHDVIFSRELKYNVVCRRDTRWLNPDAAQVTLRELDGAPLALPVSNRHDQLGHRMKLQNLKFNPVAYTNNYVTALTFVISGGALSILPDSKHGKCMKGLAFIPLRDNEERFMVIGKNKGAALSHDWQKYLECYTEYQNSKEP